MVTVIGVRFKQAGKIYYFDPGELEIAEGGSVIVETSRGIEYGSVTMGPREINEQEVISPLKKVIRIATEEDRQHHLENEQKKENAIRLCTEKVIKRHLEMKVVDVEYTFDNSKIVFYFTADGRVDFRELVKDLAQVFRMRIELRQIGVRDEAKMLGGLGSCGKPLCCSTWLPDFQPVSIKMAKVQNLSLNPTKISGICGRLMCCLKYENDTYNEARRRLPDVGDIVKHQGKDYCVFDVNLLRETLKVREILQEKTENEPAKYGNDLITLKPGEYKMLHHKKKSFEKDKEILEELDAETREELSELMQE